MQLPVKFKCKTIHDRYYIGAPHFGHCIESIVDDKYVGQTIKFQDRLLRNLKQIIKNNRKMDPYGLINDEKYQGFYKILSEMISPNHF